MDVAAAEAQFTEWIGGANAIALLRAGHETGLLDALRKPAAAGDVAERLGLDPMWTAILCQALDAHGIVVREDGRYRADDGFLALDHDDRPSTLTDRLGFCDVLRLAIAEGGAATTGFTTVSEEESITLARAVWGRPTSSIALDSFAELDDAIPEARDLWQAGAHHAEFGCGVGRDLLRIVVMYPAVTAVGYELLPHIADETRRNAAELGIEDRLTIETRDVLSLDDEDAFDTILWSQMFFGPAIRPRAIDVIRRALRPRGVLVMPVMADLPDPDATDPRPPVRMQLTAAVAYRRWGIHWVPEAEIVAELEAAGFTHLRTVPHVRGTPFVAMRPTA